MFDFEKWYKEWEKALEEAPAPTEQEILKRVNPVHGKVVEVRLDPWHNVIVYEDGYEDRYYIGD